MGIMGLTVEELITELEKYDENKKVRVLFGMPTPILWLSHQDMMIDTDYEEGCTIFTSDEIDEDIRPDKRIDTVGDLLWHLQFYKKDAIVCNYDLECCSTTIQEVSDKVTDAEGNIVDMVFLINLVHIVG